jgi:hypothetical protein
VKLVLPGGSGQVGTILARADAQDLCERWRAGPTA